MFFESMVDTLKKHDLINKAFSTAYLKKIDAFLKRDFLKVRHVLDFDVKSKISFAFPTINVQKMLKPRTGIDMAHTFALPNGVRGVVDERPTC